MLHQINFNLINARTKYIIEQRNGFVWKLRKGVAISGGHSHEKSSSIIFRGGRYVNARFIIFY